MNAPKIDVKKNRASRKWSAKERAGRVLWGLAHPFFRFSPRLLWGWRRFMLRLFGADIGRGVQVYPTARITIPWNITIADDGSIGDHAILYALGPIALGERTTVSQYGHLCAGSHDWRSPEVQLTKPPIVVGNDVWICADAFVGPGVTIGDGAVVGARAVVMKDVAPSAVMSGNPAKQIGSLEDSGQQS